jgi:hypothetical protein
VDRIPFPKQIQYETDDPTELARQLSRLEDSTSDALATVCQRAVSAPVSILVGSGAPVWGNAPIGSLWIDKVGGTVTVRTS